MKKYCLLNILLLFSIATYSQYNVGTSTKSTDIFGREVTTHRDSYGRVTGTSTTSTDIFGNRVTNHTDSYGRSTGTSTTSTDIFGNTKTQQQSTNKNSSIWTW